MIYLAFLFHLITLKIVSFFPSFSYFSLLSHSQSPESGEKNISLGSFLYIRKVHCAIQYNPDKPREKSKMESALGFYSTTKNWNRCPNFAIVKEVPTSWDAQLAEALLDTRSDMLCFPVSFPFLQHDWLAHFCIYTIYIGRYVPSYLPIFIWHTYVHTMIPSEFLRGKQKTHPETNTSSVKLRKVED